MIVWHICGTALGETISLGVVLAGGDEGNRTPNPRLAKAVLCQLSYGPWDQRRSGAVVASCQSARSSLAALTFRATSAAAPTTPAMMRSFFSMWG